MSNTMSRKFFEEILSVLHLSDKINPDKQNKMTKIRPFFDMTTKSCIENWPDSPDLSADESVVPYYVQNNSKQRMQSKPVRSGCKMWVLAEPLGYAVTLTHIKMQKMECQRKHVKRLGFLGRLLFSISLMLCQSKRATYSSWTFYNRLATEIFSNKQH